MLSVLSCNCPNNLHLLSVAPITNATQKMLTFLTTAIPPSTIDTDNSTFDEDFDTDSTIQSSEDVITTSTSTENTISELVTSVSFETTESISTLNIYESSELDSTTTTAYLSTVTDAITTTSTPESQIEPFFTTIQTSTLSIGAIDQIGIGRKEKIYRDDSLLLSSIEINTSSTSESLLSSPEYTSLNPTFSLDVSSSLDPLSTQSGILSFRY